MKVKAPVWFKLTGGIPLPPCVCMFCVCLNKKESMRNIHTSNTSDLHKVSLILGLLASVIDSPSENVFQTLLDDPKSTLI